MIANKIFFLWCESATWTHSVVTDSFAVSKNFYDKADK